MSNYKDRIEISYPVFNEMIKKNGLFKQPTVDGGVAGEIAVSDIKQGDELVNVINLADGVDLTAEFTITKDGIIDNTGGTDTSTDKLLVGYIPWEVR